MESIDDPEVAYLLYILKKSSKGGDDLPIGFHRNTETREPELTIVETAIGTYQNGLYLRDVFHFAEHQEKATFWLGFVY